MLRRMLLLTAFMALACSGGGGPPDGDFGDEGEETVVDPRTLIEVGTVETGTVGDFLVSNGTVESEAQADLVPETTGTVIAIKAEEGDTVRKGQVLAVIDNATLDAALARAEAEATKALAELDKIRSLHDQGVLSDRDLQDAEFAEAAARTALAEARSTQGHTRLVSPINGTVAVRQIEYGEVAGGQLAFQVVDLSKLRVVIRLPERDLTRLSVGQSATLTSVYDDDSGAFNGGTQCNGANPPPSVRPPSTPPAARCASPSRWTNPKPACCARASSSACASRSVATTTS